MTATLPARTITPVRPRPEWPVVRRRHRTPPSDWVGVYGASLGVALFVVAHRAMPDDALITLAFARSVVQDGCLCVTDEVSVNTMTSPLHLALLVPPLTVGVPPFWVVGGLLAAELAAIAICLRRIAGAAAAVWGTALLATSPVYGSAVGMETFLAAAVLIGLILAATRRRTVIAGALCAAAVLTRPDLVVAVTVVVVLLAASRGRSLLWALPLGAALSSPYFVLSWLRLGSAWPHTVAIKSVGGGWFGGDVYLWNGLTSYFWPAFPGTTAVTVVTLVAGLLAFPFAVRDRDWAAVALIAAGAASLLALGVTQAPPTAYYAGPGIAGLGVGAVLVAVRRPIGRSAVVALVGASVGVAAAHGTLWADGLAPIRQNWATNDQYHAIAAGLPRDGLVLSTTEIGALAYYCQDHGCRITDVVLSDPGFIDERVQQWRATRPWADFNYAHYERPSGPLPATYELQFGFIDDRAGTLDWPITRYPGMHQWARLELLPVPP